jgi:hypothetical protein
VHIFQKLCEQKLSPALKLLRNYGFTSRSMVFKMQRIVA